jgi:hypothetical protein
VISSRWACCCLLGLYDDLVIVPAANATPSRPPCYTSWHSRSTHGGYGLAVRGRVLAGSTDAELSRVRNSPIDITGLDANQQNVIRTYLSNQENAKAFAEMAKEMAMQSHNTQNSGKIMDSITAAKNADTISQDEAKSLVKDHLQQQIDDGAGKRTQAEAASQAAATPLSQAAVTAAAQGKDITASRLDSSGNSESVTIHGSTTSSTVLAEASGTVPHLRQSPNRQSDCWAVAAAILISWNKQQPVSVEDAVGAAGEEHRQLYLTNTGLPTASKDDFVLRSQMTAEPPRLVPARAVHRLAEDVRATLGDPGLWRGGLVLTARVGADPDQRHRHPGRGRYRPHHRPREARHDQPQPRTGGPFLLQPAPRRPRRHQGKHLATQHVARPHRLGRPQRPEAVPGGNRVQDRRDRDPRRHHRR